MDQARNDIRPSKLLEVGTDIRVHSQSGFKTYSHGRISIDNGTIVIDVIRKFRGPQELPIILKTVVLDIDEIVRISFRNINGKRISLLGDSNYWLSDIPKSIKNSVLVLCREKNRTVDISCGWVEYTRNKIIVHEIVSIKGTKHEVDTHERHMPEVVLVLISNDAESKVCARITETK